MRESGDPDEIRVGEDWGLAGQDGGSRRSRLGGQSGIRCQSGIGEESLFLWRTGGTVMSQFDVEAALEW